MMSRFLKATAVAAALLFVLQGCAVFVRDEDDFHHHHERWGPHEHWEHGHSSLEQKPQFARQVDEN